MTSRERATFAARIAAYGSAVARTPADYTLKEALQVYGKEMVQTANKKRKRKRWEVEDKEEAE